MPPHQFRVADPLALQHIERSQRGGDGDRIAPEGRGMRTGRPVHNFGARNQSTERHAAGNAFGNADHVGLDAGVLHRPPLAAAPHAGLHFVDHQQDAVTVADSAQLLHECRRSGQVAAFALYGLHKDGRALLGSHFGPEDHVFDMTRRFDRVLIGRDAGRTAIQIRKWGMNHARNQRRETAALLHLGAGKRERSHRPPVEAAVERNQSLPLGVIARQFQRGLDRLRP